MSNCSGSVRCVRSPVWSRNSGGFGNALMRMIASRVVPTTSVFAGLLKPMWLSLIWTKFSSAVAIAFRLFASWPNAVEVNSPPLIDQMTPVPAQAIHLRNPRRSMSS